MRGINPRSVAVGALSFICMARGIAYIRPQDLPFGLDVASRFIPIWILASAWLIAGTAGMYVAITRRSGPGILGVQVAMSTFWGLSYLGAWMISGFKSLEWVPATVYLPMALVIASLAMIPPRPVI